MTEAEYEALLLEAEKLMFRDRTVEEDIKLGLIIERIEPHENKIYPIPSPKPQQSDPLNAPGSQE